MHRRCADVNKYAQKMIKFVHLEKLGIVRNLKHKQGYIYYNQKFLNILSY